MTLVELLVFLLVTGGAGALVGGAIGFFVHRTAGGAKIGALLGPVAAGVVITILFKFWERQEKVKQMSQDRIGSP